jgi:L-alanine-DL-glutamate epimerase-like enolase superfamily enzyme
MIAPFRIESLRALVYRCPIDTPVVTSFGLMRDRPMVLVRAQDDSGAVGWGEIWCNFPSVGAEHRARLLTQVLAPRVEGRSWTHPQDVFADLSQGTSVLALQSGEPGPFAHTIAGIDLALWDLVARRAGQPLWRLLGGASPTVRVYASGLNPDRPDLLARARCDEGHTAFKLKIGFEAARDRANLQALRRELGEGVELMVDANQGWSLEQALQRLDDLAPFGLRWLEEPLRADVPWPQWRRLAEHASMPIAAGENIAGDDAFAHALEAGVLTVFQPDAGKWGGHSACLPVARAVLAAGRRFCPHWLGGGIGLLHSAHLLAAAGGDGRLEIDSNANPLRSLVCGPLNDIHAGQAVLTDTPGIGPEPDLSAIARYAAKY